MRKVYVVIGTHTEIDDYYNWVSGVYSSYKKARPENEYSIKTEVLI